LLGIGDDDGDNCGRVAPDGFLVNFFDVAFFLLFFGWKNFFKSDWRVILKMSEIMKICHKLLKNLNLSGCDEKTQNKRLLRPISEQMSGGIETVLQLS
jgi:hypothetical protein